MDNLWKNFQSTQYTQNDRFEYRVLILSQLLEYYQNIKNNAKNYQEITFSNINSSWTIAK